MKDANDITFAVQIVHGLSIPLGKIGYLAPRTLSRVLTETSISTGPDLPGLNNNGSAFSTISRWFPGGNGAVVVATTETVVGPPMSRSATSEVSKAPPVPPTGDVPLDALGPDAGPPDGPRNGVRETQIRFHDELEFRNGVASPSRKTSPSPRPSPSLRPSPRPR